jgi:hypothetical protein
MIAQWHVWLLSGPLCLVFQRVSREPTCDGDRGLKPVASRCFTQRSCLQGFLVVFHMRTVRPTVRGWQTLVGGVIVLTLEQ